MSQENKKRVGLFVDSLMGGGAERVALNFAEKFIELGHDARVFVLHPPIEHQTGEVPIHLVSEQLKLADWRPLNKWLYARRISDLVRQIEADGKPFDFFISNAEDSDRLTRMAGLRPVFIRYRNSLQHFLAAKLGDTKGLKRRIRHVRWLNKFRRFYSGHIVTVSRALEDELVHEIGLKPKSIKTIYNPFDFDLLRRRAAEPRELPGEPYILYPARLTPRKRQDLLLRAYAQSGVHLPLVLLGGVSGAEGEKYEIEMKSLAAELGIAERVRFLGFEQNPYPWIKGAKLVAMSSDSEGLPTVLIESLILGTPVVSTDCPTGPAEILTGDLARFLSPVGDAPALAANIRAALESYPVITGQHIERFRAENTIRCYLENFHEISSK
ncbi:MAG: glycosyltransferase [Azonexus sp.]|nr:glycosyltransferase [Azonexus sp.]MDP3638020.1 glycosyltransferase [Azonexus sp.]MDZ4315124.1 glycosyltransferase [Azonexus sp.]